MQDNKPYSPGFPPQCRMGLPHQPRMGRDARALKVNTETFDRSRGEGRLEGLRIAFDPAAEPAGRSEQKHSPWIFVSRADR